MPNILLTDYCNRHCEFCFGGKLVKRSRKNGRALSLEDFDFLLGWAKKEVLPFVSLIGGEPTQHPQLDLILQKVRESGLPCRMFTNGLYSKKTVEMIRANADPDGLTLIVNFLEPAKTRPAHLNKLQRTFSQLAPFINLAATIDRADFDFQYLTGALDQYPFKKVMRLGFAVPNLESDNAHLAIDEQKKVVPALMAFAGELDKRKFRIDMDCGWALCAFTPEDLGRLIYLGMKVYNSQCLQSLDIGPNLDVWPCFPLGSRYRANLKDFNSFREASNHFQKLLAPFTTIGSEGKCLGCVHLERGICSGGCLAAAIKAFDH